ncbi:hypothetical protein AX15_003267 [Amanita polypyramis BW_CC]|nr:hypothetical protein AX15_003267 [Amanita polypyramis BW_CC]
MLSNAEAVIIANNSRAFQFGVYFVTFVLCLRWLLYTDEGWSLRRNIKWLEVTATVMIFVLSVANIALSLESTLAICRGKTDTYLTGIITSIIEALTAIIIEVILIFRCWIIHHRSWRTITPPLLLLLYSVCGIVIVTYWSTLHLTGRQNVNFTWIKRVHGSFFVSTILINIYATSAIVLRIQRDSYFQDLHFVIRNITESGTLYTLTSILAICAISIGRSPTLESPTARVVACVMVSSTIL